MTLLLCIWVLCHFLICDGLRGQELEKVGDEFVPDYSEFYYYREIQEKVVEIMSINNCTAHGDSRGYEPQSGARADIEIKIVPPAGAILQRWGTEGNEFHNVSRIFARTTSNLCSAKAFMSFQRGGTLYAKGCLKMYKTGAKGGERVKAIDRYAATLHPEHVRCDVKQSLGQCVSASRTPLQVPTVLRSLHSYPFMVTTRNAIISRSGFLALPCGPVGLFASCEAVKYGVPSSTALISYVQGCRDSKIISGEVGGSDCPYLVYDRVFVMTQYDDTQIGQFVMEALPKLVYHLDFLLANPDIKIHFGFTKRDNIPSFVLPHNIFNWLGLGDRLIKGPVYGKEIFVPREGGCQDAGYNAWEVLTTRDTFMRLADVDQDSLGAERSIVIIKRTASRYVANRSDLKQRRWPKLVFDEILASLERSFPNHRVDVFSDSDMKLMKCRECQIRMFSDADVTIAIHGAGLTNTMFMRPGGIVVEVIPTFDSRHAPLIGIFPRLSAIVGLNHYSYYAPDGIMSVDGKDLIDKTLVYAVDTGLKI
jgi:Glycosyltransferase 61